MDELLNHPAIQAAAAPFVAGLIAAGLLYRARLGGLAVIAGFATAVAMISGFNFTPLTATRKIVLLGLLSPLAGIAVDMAFRPNRWVNIALALAAAAASLWVFWAVLVQKEFADALRLGAITAIATGAIALLTLSLAGKPVRAASAGLALGLGSGICAVLAASALYGQYGIATGAACGAFLLLQMMLGRGVAAGATFALTAALLTGLFGAAAMLLASLPWYALALLVLIPVGARVPLPRQAPVWLQAILASICAMLPALAAFYLTWTFTGTASG
jgi:hypothetical protein